MKSSKKQRKSVFSPIRAVLSVFFNKLLVKILVTLALLAALFFGGKFSWKKLGEVKTEKSSALVFQELKRCSELVTVKNSYSDVITIKKSRIAGFAKTFTIVKYTGVIRGGIADITQAEISVSERGKRVRVRLPKSEVLSNDISNIEVFDETRSIFVEISLKEVMGEIRFNQESSSADIIATGFLDEADSQARKVVESVLYAAGFEEVIVE